MFYVADRTGRFETRPHFEANELDTMCDRALIEHLDHRGEKLSYPISTDLLQTLIEAHAASLDLYADLSAEGGDVQGVTDFFPGRRPKVRIEAGLASDPRREVRLRTTLAHEFGHVHLHDSLFQAKTEALDLFSEGRSKGRESTDRLARCKRDTIVEAQPTDWMEWQAGYVCGALLMPRRVLRELVHGRLRAAGEIDELVLASPLGRKLTDEIAEKFLVSTEAARVRMKVLGLAVDKRTERSVFE